MTNPSAAANLPPARATLKGPFGRRAIRLGSIQNIEVGLDISWLFIFGLVTISLASQFEAEHENWGTALYWGAGLIASLLFFSSILLHELGHSLTSNALGLPVESITLFIFGGLAKLSGRPTSPRDEFLIGAAGPAVSVLLGLLFLGLANLSSDTTLLGEMSVAIFSWLGMVNLILVVFNLFPGYPLDGGHLLRAAVWSVTGKERVGTLVVSKLGLLFALLLIGVGAVSVLAMGAVQGFWLVLIGWFLMRASRGAVDQEILEERLGAISVAEAMVEDCLRMPGHVSVEELISGAILKRGERQACVQENGEFLGLVTLNEVKTVPPSERSLTPISAIMTPRSRLVTISSEESLWIAMTKMSDSEVNQLPVLEGERLLGVITREQLLRVMRNQLDLAKQDRHAR